MALVRSAEQEFTHLATCARSFESALCGGESTAKIHLAVLSGILAIGCVARILKQTE